MTVQEYLSQAREQNRVIEYKLEQAARLRAQAEKCTQVLSDMPKTPGSSTDGLAASVERIITLEQEINAEIDSLYVKKIELQAFLSAIPDPLSREILEQRYVDCKGWSEISARMRYSLRWVHTLHDRAIEAAAIFSEKVKVST